MNKKILITMGDGVEEMEFVVMYDQLLRANFEVDVAFMNGEKKIVCGRGLTIEAKELAEVYLSDLNKYDALYIPGGPGTNKLDENDKMDGIIKHFIDNDKVIGAICAAPLLLAKRGYLKGVNSMSHSSVMEVLKENGAIIKNESCKWNEECSSIVDGNFVTGLDHLSTQNYSFKFIDKVNSK